MKRFIKYVKKLIKLPHDKKYNEICEQCDRFGIRCNVNHFKQNFNNWTSGNNCIDEFIVETQICSHIVIGESYALEWIPYDKFYDIKFIAKGGFGKVYRANWIDGHMNKWDINNQSWNRNNQNEFVALKSINDSKNVTLEFMNEITLHHKLSSDFAYINKFHGITQDPETKNYMMVLDYAKNGSLRNYLDKNYNELNWKIKIIYLWYIAFGLDHIHKNGIIHRDLHIGNILHMGDMDGIYITDMGLCKPADCYTSKSSIYGVLPYIAPEILRGKNYTKAADIYSFAMRICLGLRPRFNNIKVPQLIVHLIKRCLDANPLNRPTTDEIEKILSNWYIYFDDNIRLQNQIVEADNINNNKFPKNNTSLSPLSYETHSEAIYASRLLSIDNLPEPKNSDDYYERCDNIISGECLGIDKLNLYESISIFLNTLKSTTGGIVLEKRMQSKRIVDEETQPDSSSKNKYISGENPLARKLGIWLIWTIHTLKKLIEELSSETLIHAVQLLRWKAKWIEAREPYKKHDEVLLFLNQNVHTYLGSVGTGGNNVDNGRKHIAGGTFYRRSGKE
ncbi:kinase-like protein [Rhizophagus irregularis]|uniref:Kinase-like protein n=1 Tax=Rhizophagus irregularis TaxID=588596 RepID=A0A2I1HBN7_9GLOM|nr:kinase-like protein [Rhizophagus irregularis]